MPHLVFLSPQIKFGMAASPRTAGNSLHHAKPRAFQLLHFVRIIRQQPQLANAQRLQRLGRKFVIARIRREPKFAVGLHGIEPRLLQFVSPQFIDQSNAAPFLRQIKQHSRRLLRNLLQRKLKLRPAIASLRSKHIPSQTLRMDAPPRSLSIPRFPRSQRPPLNRNRLFASPPLDTNNPKIPEASRQLRPRDKPRPLCHPRAISLDCRGSLWPFTGFFSSFHENQAL